MYFSFINIKMASFVKVGLVFYFDCFRFNWIMYLKWNLICCLVNIKVIVKLNKHRKILLSVLKL